MVNHTITCFPMLGRKEYRILNRGDIHFTLNSVYSGISYLISFKLLLPIDKPKTIIYLALYYDILYLHNNPPGP